MANTFFEDLNRLDNLLEAEGDENVALANEYVDKINDLSKNVVTDVDDNSKLSADIVDNFDDDKFINNVLSMPTSGLSSIGVLNLINGNAEDLIQDILDKVLNSDISDITIQLFSDKIVSGLQKLGITFGPDSLPKKDIKVKTSDIVRSVAKENKREKKSLGLFGRIKQFLSRNRDKIKSEPKENRVNTLKKIGISATAAAVVFAIIKNKNKIMKKIYKALDNFGKKELTESSELNSIPSLYSIFESVNLPIK